MIFRGQRHRQIYEKIRRKKDLSNRYLASAYLLSADIALWNKSTHAVEQGRIDFEKILLSDMSVEAYTFYAVAKDIYTGSEHLSMSDYTDHALLAPLTYKIIRQAIELARRGERPQNGYN
jgi:hypothetical protein